jgi:regulator of sirC expression with transglutaminase-like and TPR domain
VRYTAAPALIEAFTSLAGSAVSDDAIDLTRAALLISRTRYPNLDIEAYAARIDSLARRVAGLVPKASSQSATNGIAKDAPKFDARQTISALNYVLFGELGLRGNRDDYYDPRNSFLNDVLDRGLGIPISLSVVYLEVARRVGFPVAGIGMPGHFLLKYRPTTDTDSDGNLPGVKRRNAERPGSSQIDANQPDLNQPDLNQPDLNQEVLIDCFNQGHTLSPEDCQERLNEIYSGEMNLRPEFLHPVNHRQILARMLNNLKTVYLSTRDFRKALIIADLILVIRPRSAEDVKQRALLRYSLEMHNLAAEDLEEYLRLVPAAEDAGEVKQMSLSIRRMLAAMN